MEKNAEYEMRTEDIWRWCPNKIGSTHKSLKSWMKPRALAKLARVKVPFTLGSAGFRV